MFRQDIIFRIVVNDEELKQAYIDSYKANYKFGDRGFDLIVPRDYKIYVGSRSNKIDHEIQVAGYFSYSNNSKGIIPGLATTVIEHEVGYDVRLRSGTGAKTAFRLSNQVGTIDLYRGNIIALIDHIVSYTQADLFSGTSSEKLQVCEQTGKEYVLITKGTRLVQLVNPNGFGCKVEFVDELPTTERDSNGFGSSGGI